MNVEYNGYKSTSFLQFSSVRRYILDKPISKSLRKSKEKEKKEKKRNPAPKPEKEDEKGERQRK